MHQFFKHEVDGSSDFMGQDGKRFSFAVFADQPICFPE